jgi:hypothetical protein
MVITRKTVDPTLSDRENLLTAQLFHRFRVVAQLRAELADRIRAGYEPEHHAEDAAILDRLAARYGEDTLPQPDLIALLREAFDTPWAGDSEDGQHLADVLATKKKIKAALDDHERHGFITLTLTYAQASLIAARVGRGADGDLILHDPAKSAPIHACDECCRILTGDREGGSRWGHAYDCSKGMRQGIAERIGWLLVMFQHRVGTSRGRR